MMFLTITSIWSNVFFYFFIGTVLMLIVLVTFFMRAFKDKNRDIKSTNQQHVAKIDAVRKEHADTLERIRIDMLKREDERTRQWIESEKEALHVLNGVSTLLDLSEKIGKLESDKILQKFEDILNKVKEIHTKVEKISKN